MDGWEAWPLEGRRPPQEFNAPTDLNSGVRSGWPADQYPRDVDPPRKGNQ